MNTHSSNMDNELSTNERITRHRGLHNVGTDRYNNVEYDWFSVEVDGNLYYVEAVSNHGYYRVEKIGSDIEIESHIPNPESVEHFTDDEMQKLVWKLEETLDDAVKGGGGVYEADYHTRFVRLNLAHYEGWTDAELEAMNRRVYGTIEVTGDVEEEIRELIRGTLG